MLRDDLWLKLRGELPESTLAAAAHGILGAQKLPAYLPAGLADELPEGPGVYRFFDEHGELLYIGRSHSLRTRILGHFRADDGDAKEQKKALRVRRIDWQETAGILGAQLKELEAIRTQKPFYNKRPKSTADCCTFIPVGADQGSVRIAALSDVSEAECFGIFHSWKDARKALGDIARAHGLCLKILRLEESAGSCVAHQMGKCRGACVGKEPMILHDVRAMLALSALKLKPWPFPGRIALKGGPFRLSCARPVGVSRHGSLGGGAFRTRARAIERGLRSGRVPHLDPVSGEGSGCRLARSSRRLRVARPHVMDNVRYWIATAPIGAASVLAEELALLRRERCP